ncbi:MAG: polyribonucleotide nucleotidyltransferase [Deltaproteobacteria bacterium RIFOXYA12_FULL_61_11]|nr:MAG: polyribonucleotide nucleotidyltransferase [Deltaproteobacteria bacterium RIFOXYA12_FULL_61_11]
MRAIHYVEMDFNGRTFSLEVGRIANQANGAVLVRYGETAVIVTATMSSSPREKQDFFPLTVDYLERTYAAGKIPGGFFKREGKLSDQETLSSRVIDRTIRPLFPKHFFHDIQIMAQVISLGMDGNSDALALIGASAALMVSDIPFHGPVAGVRVARIDGQLVIDPPYQDLERADLNVFVSGTRSAITMVEGGSREVNEDEMLEALLFGQQQLQHFIVLQEHLMEKVSKVKFAVPLPERDETLLARIDHAITPRMEEALQTPIKQVRSAQKRELQLEALAMVDPAQRAEVKGQVAELLHDIEAKVVRRLLLEKGLRIDGRRPIDIREIHCDVDLIPRTHGMSLFTRGETQALVVTTLGTSGDTQTIDSIYGEYYKHFMLHYNFPAFSTGEVKPLRNPGRREIGHGNLAERALSYVVPSPEEFPYTIRVVSDILESNGSSSMATVCGGTLALMAAGVPISAPVAGIAMGLVKEGDKVAILSDILGDEDHVGDMDFKVAGTMSGITAIQMDIKCEGLDPEIMRRALYQAREGRHHILGVMMQTIDAPRTTLSEYAPQIITMKIKPEKIRDLIGPGGKNIKHIVEVSKAKIDVDDDGTVMIFSPDTERSKIAVKMVEELTAEPEVGRIYSGKVVRVADFGAFVEIMPGVDGLVHISHLAEGRVKTVRDVVTEGDVINVKVIEIDRMGKIRLSLKEAQVQPER